VFNLKSKKLILVLVVIFSLFLISFSILALRTPFVYLLRFPVSLIHAVQRELGGIVFYHRNLTENQSLRREVDFLRYKVNALNEAYLENVRLKNLLSFKQSSSFKFIVARVILRPQDNWSSSLIIDKGSYSGIKEGMAAVTYLGFIGRVVETTNSTAKIMLITDPNLGVSGLVQRSRQEGLVSGTLGSNLIMKYLPEDADIKLQDTIVTSGLNNNYPKGLFIGSVIDIGKDFSGLSRYAVIKPAVNLSNIEEVLVIVQ
jgi:rod shape-determining protein MreC